MGPTLLPTPCLPGLGRSMGRLPIRMCCDELATLIQIACPRLSTGGAARIAIPNFEPRWHQSKPRSHRIVTANPGARESRQSLSSQGLASGSVRRSDRVLRPFPSTWRFRDQPFTCHPVCQLAQPKPRFPSSLHGCNQSAIGCAPLTASAVHLARSEDLRSVGFPILLRASLPCHSVMFSLSISRG
jgi:hypothetical protein